MFIKLQRSQLPTKITLKQSKTYWTFLMLEWEASSASGTLCKNSLACHGALQHWKNWSVSNRAWRHFEIITSNHCYPYNKAAHLVVASNVISAAPQWKSLNVKYWTLLSGRYYSSHIAWLRWGDRCHPALLKVLSETLMPRIKDLWHQCCRASV